MLATFFFFFWKVDIWEVDTDSVWNENMTPGAILNYNINGHQLHVLFTVSNL